MDQKLIIPPKTKAINLYFVRLSVKCSTKIVKKANGDCACGFILWEVLTWTQAIQACKARGARLAEIYSISFSARKYLAGGYLHSYLLMGRT